MSFKAELTFDNNDGASKSEGYNVLECSWEFNVATDRKGKRTENLKGGQISVTLESSRHFNFMSWIQSGDDKDGQIYFAKSGESVQYKIFFYEADCIHYSEEFMAGSKMQMITRIIIAPARIQVHNASVQEIR